jgi:phosphate-selective porin OprO/OprP
MNLFLRFAALAMVVAFAAPRAAAADAANPSLQKEVESYLAETPAAAPADNTLKAFYKNGLNFENSDKSFTSHIGGRIEFDQAYFSSTDYAHTDSWFFRELFAVTEGTIFTNAFYRMELDFSSGAVALRDVFISLKNCGPAGTFQAGQYKVITCLSDQTSLRFVTFMERPACVNAFAYSYEDGFSLQNNFLEDKMLYGGVEVFKILTSTGTATDNGGYGFATRWVVAFLEDKDKNQVLQLGINYNYSTTPAGTVQYRARPDIGTGARLVDTGTFAAHDQNVFDFEGLFVYQKLHVQAEFFWVTAKGNGGPEPTFTGFYVEVGYWLIGGMDNYNKGAKKLDRPKIEETFHTGSGRGRGAWQVAIQFDNVDLTDSGIAGGKQNCITLGLRWFWNPQMCMKFNIVWADISDGGPFGTGNMVVFGTRFQVDF